MALVTVQRSPSPSTDPDSEGVDGEEGSGRSPLRNRRSHKQNVQRLRKLFHSVRFLSKLRPCLSESYFTVRGAALILPQGERPRKSSKKSHGGDIQHHLQSMLYLLRHEDRIKVAVKLEASDREGHQRYMALVSTVGRQDTEESVIIGMDYMDHLTTIGLVLPIYNGTQIRLSGDGGFRVKICTDDRKYMFNPVSVQAMWSALQSLQKAVKIADDETYIPKGLTHTWVQYYTSQIENSRPEFVHEWNVMEGIDVLLSDLVTSDLGAEIEMKAKITKRLTEVMMKVDLDEATSRSLRIAVEEVLGEGCIRPYKEYFDMELMRILGQMDAPSRILDYLFLGTEWNASNIEELNENGVKYILNVTQEIDNFFPHQLKYMNVRVEDYETSQLLPYWDKTYRFISKARKNGSKVLVHCKRGISRSASTVIAYIMKENKWSLDDTLQFVKNLRSVINPNSGFREQLRTYEGILNASNQRHMFKSQSVENLPNKPSEEEDLPTDSVFLEGADLYRQMFESGYNPASEDEVLHSLTKGRELEDQDMIRIGTDLETGSRSTDSLEESFPDIPSPTPECEDAAQKNKTSSKGDYYLTMQYDDTVATSRKVAGLELIKKEYASDVEDETSVAFFRGRRSPNVSPVVSISESAAECDVATAAQSRLRPDNSWIKLETESEETEIQCPSTRDDNDIQMSNSPPKFIIGESFGTSPKQESPLKRGKMLSDRVKSVNSVSSRVRSASLGDGKEPETVQKYETDLNRLSIRNRTSSLDSRRLNPPAAFEEPMEEEESHSEVSAVAVASVDTDKPEQSTPAVVLDRQAQLGITQYYTNEQIPWCPGTVKKIKSDFSKHLHSSDEESESAQKDSDLCKPELDQPLFETNITDVSVQPDQPREVNSERLTQSCVELPAHDENMDVSDDVALPRRPQSVYEAEDIQLPEGMVRMVKDMLEAKRLCDDQDSESESHPVQRSASLKEARAGSKARRSERRKTCSPIMSPARTSPPHIESTSHLLGLEDIEREITLVSDQKSEVVMETNGEDKSEADKNITLFKCGQEEVPLEKGLVKKHKQDFESRSDNEMRKRLSSESSISSVTLDTQEHYPLKDEGLRTSNAEMECDELSTPKGSQTSGVSGQDINISSTQCDNTEYSSSSVISERMIGTVREQKLLLEGKDSAESETAPVVFPSKRHKKSDSDTIDPQTLARMREWGSEFLNQPVKPDSKVEEMQDLTLVKQAVRNLEKETKVKKQERKIIIIEEDGSEEKTEVKSKGRPSLSEKSKSFDEIGNGTMVFKRTQQWVRDGNATSFEDAESKDGKASRSGMSLDLEHSGKPESEQQHVPAGSISPRSDSEPSIVRHLVGRFEKDLKSPGCDNVEGSGSNRSSISVGDFGLCFADTKKKKDEGQMSDCEMRAKSPESAISRPLRPKSADHIGKLDSVPCEGLVKTQMDDQESSHQVACEASEVDSKLEDTRKVRRVHGQPNPVPQRLGASPFYNTM